MSKQYRQHLSEPWFTLISLGLKTVEGRKNKGVFKEMQVGDIVEWFNDDYKPRTIFTEITDKRKYKTFSDFLEKEGLENALPGMHTLEYGLSVYLKPTGFFTKEDEKTYGVIAIELELVE